MAKKYERKNVLAEAVSVDFDIQIEKKDGGTYKGTRLTYRAGGEVRDKGMHYKTFQYKKDLKAQLESLNYGDQITIKLYREEGSQYWNIDSVVKGHHPDEQPASPVGSSESSGGSYNNNANPAAIGQAMNLAVELGVMSSYNDMLDDAKVIESIGLYKSAKKKFTELWDKNYEGEVQAQGGTVTEEVAKEVVMESDPF